VDAENASEKNARLEFAAKTCTKCRGRKCGRTAKYRKKEHVRPTALLAE